MADTINATSFFGLPDKINLIGAEVTPFALITSMIIIVAGFVIARATQLIVMRYSSTRLPPDARKTVGRTFYYGIVAIALLSALGVSGLDLSGLFIAGGFAGIVIGFATQSLFSNLISGIFLHIDKPMKIGDPVLITGKLPEVAGVVVEVTALSSRLRMFDGTFVRLPNSDVFMSEIRNFSAAAVKRVEMTIRIAYREDTTRVIDAIKKSLAETPLVMVEPPPDLYVDALADSSVNINVWCWVPFSAWFDMKKQLLEQVKMVLDANGIDVPFPQRVVHMPDEKRRRQKGGDPSSLDRGSSPAGVNLQELSEG